MTQSHSDTTKTFKAGTFCMDGLEGQFAGYSDGEMWNGWACPYFERQVAESVLRASERNGYRWKLDMERDTFVVKSVADPEDYEPEEIAGQVVTVDGAEVRLYPVGAYSWVWEAC